MGVDMDGKPMNGSVGDSTYSGPQAPARLAPDQAAEADRSGNSLQKAIRVLNVVATGSTPLSAAEIAAETGISRPTVYRIVHTLVAEGYLLRAPDNGRLSIGLSTLPLAASVLDQHRLRLESLPHLQALAERTGQRTNLGVLHEGRVLYLAGVEKPSLPTIYSRFGRTVPAHASSLGKAILAYLEEGEVAALARTAPLVALTPNTITSLRVLQRELRRIAADGYAVDREEASKGTFCVSAPIFGDRHRPIGAIGLSGRALEPLLAETEALLHAAEVIAHML